MSKNKNYLLCFLIVLLAIPLMLPLFHSGFFTIHDNAQIQRTYEMAKALNDGMLPVRWSMDLGYGYGYPIFNFYAPFIYYLASIFIFVGFSAIVSTKIMMATGIILSGVGMFVLTKKLFSPAAGVVGAVIYMYAPYHALDIYVRGDMAEAFAYTLIPWLFYFLLQAFEQMKKRWLFWGTVTFAILIITHNLTALMLTPFLLAFAIVLLIRQRREPSLRLRMIRMSAIIICGILLAAFYWLPAVSEMKFTDVASVTKGGSDYHQHFVCLSQLWDSPWGFGGSAPGCTDDGISFRIGKLAIMLSFMTLLTTLILLILGKYADVVQQKLIWIFVSAAGLFICVFMMLSWSLFIWDSLPFMAYFQFPWRFLLLAMFFISILSGASICLFELLVQKIKQKAFIVAVVVILCLFITWLTNAKLFQPQQYVFLSDNEYLGKKNLLWATSRISDEYLPPNMLKPQTEQQAVSFHPITTSHIALVRSLQQSTTSLQADILTIQSQTVTLHIAPFPAWHVFVDNKEIPFRKTSTGLQVPVPIGLHRMRAAYISTSLETLADIVSVAGILILLAAILIIV